MSNQLLYPTHDKCKVIIVTSMTVHEGAVGGGLRERKKLQSRQHISNVATSLFIERGFEQTTIADVAAAAEVAKMTVTNYFAQKEDLVFDRADMLIRLLADAVLQRTAGESVLAAVRRAYDADVVEQSPILGFAGVSFARLVESSPALRAREREIFAEQEAELAKVLTEEFARSASDVRPRLAAAQLAAVFRILYYEGRRRLLADEPVSETVRALRRAAKISFDVVGEGLPV
jgi:AcrR family transcriptional regulator